MKQAIFSGSFDPFTFGHLNIVQKALQKVDRLIINVGKNPYKKNMFSLDMRLNMIERALKEVDLYDRVELISYDGLLADLALQTNSHLLIRGIRSETDDLEKEQVMARLNEYLGKVRGIELKTEFIYERDEFIRIISSSVVKKLCQHQEYITAMKFVPSVVHQKLMEKYLMPYFKNLPSEHPEIHKEFLYCKLIKEYDNRAYHNLSHIAYMINMLHIYLQTTKRDVNQNDISALYLAIFMHDYIYTPGKSDCEELSANAVQEEYGKIIDIDIAKVRRLILATEHNFVAADIDEALIADLDLSILGTFDNSIWKRYNQSIRKEYSNFADKDYAKGRVDFLQKVLLRRKIFQTDFFYNLFEIQAKKNLQKEIERLKKELS